VAGVHAGEPVSIAFLDRVGVDYLVCSPYEVPAAKVAAAQAAIRADLSKDLRAIPKPLVSFGSSLSTFVCLSPAGSGAGKKF
jgi:hypothetical protein